MAIILIADTIDGVANLKRILQPGHVLVAVNTMVDAVGKLGKQAFDLIIVGVHFEESRMFELIPKIRRFPENANTPIICFCTRDTAMTRIMHDSLNLSSRALGAWMYLDQHEYNVKRDPDAELRRVIERCLTHEARRETLAKRIDVHQQRQEIHKLRSDLEAEEWSAELEDRLGDLRRRLSKVLLSLYRQQIDSHAQHESIEESRGFADRLSDSATKAENEMTKAEEQQWTKETAQSINEQEIVDREEGKGKEGRHKVSSKHLKKPESCR